MKSRFTVAPTTFHHDNLNITVFGFKCCRLFVTSISILWSMRSYPRCTLYQRGLTRRSYATQPTHLLLLFFASQVHLSSSMLTAWNTNERSGDGWAVATISWPSG